MTDDAFPDALPVGHRLHWYVLERVLGQGGFGITYLAHDPNLDRRVAIKEYLPTEIARRRSDASARPRTESHAERYAWGLERFLSEARTLARFDHPNIVRVHSVFEANNTAYMVMRFEEGEDLATLLERSGTLPERELTGLLLPIMEGLEIVHATGFIHRDIKPENIYVRRDGSPVLLDFGSARQSFGSAKTMTILVAPGYAPLEQYYGDAATQGPWTDIYGLGATCYRAITGRAPLDAVARAKGVLGSSREMLQPAAEIGRGRYGERLLAAVDHSLKLSERDRPQRIADWRSEILLPPAPPGSHAVQAARQPQPLQAPAATPSSPAVVESKRRLPARRGWLVGGLWAGVCALLVVMTYTLTLQRTAPVTTSPPQVALVSPPASQLARVVSQASPVAAVAAPIPVPEAPPVQKAAPVDALVLAKQAAPVAAPPAGRAAAPAEPRVVIKASPRPIESQPGPLPDVVLARALPAATPAPAAAITASVVMKEPVRDEAPPRRLRDEQLDAGEAALRRGDLGAAAQILGPWASAGVPRAQALLGRAQEARSGGQRSDFEAYVWYSMAARGGEPGAQAMKDQVAARLQPAEIRQAEKIIEHWKPRAEPTVAGAP